MKTSLALVRCREYESTLVYNAIKKSVSLLGGIDKFIKPESKVLLKPNLLTSASPDRAVTTHPEVIRATINLLKEIRCKIYLGDSPSCWERVKTQEVYEITEVKRIAKEENIELVDFEHPVWKKNFPLTRWLDTCDYLISLPKFKTHNLTLLTAGVKNLLGLVCGVYKVELHRRYPEVEDFARVLIDLYELTRPALTIVDAVVALEGNGPATSGIPKNTGFILGGSDCVAIDSILAVIMGLNPLDIPTNQEARMRNLGTTRIDKIEILGDNLLDFVGKDFKLPTTSFTRIIPKPLLKVAKKLIRFYPQIRYNFCIGCGRCIDICPVKAIRIKNEKVLVDYLRCISCFCCQETCPSSAIKIKRTLFAKIIGI